MNGMIKSVTRAGVLLTVVFFGIFVQCSTPNKLARPVGNRYQVIVYGATPSGIMAATAAAREGVSVLMIEPGAHVGGVVAGGLGRTDVDGVQFIGGLSAKFLNEVAAHTPKEHQSPGRPWDLEPKIAMKVFLDWIDREKLPLLRQTRLASVVKMKSKITAVTTDKGLRYEADVFIDATYEGDLMAMAGIAYIVGREPRSRYNEPVAGFYQNPTVVYDESDYCKKHFDLGGPRHNNPRYLHNTQFGANLSPYDDKGKLLWGINPGPKPAAGAGDSLIQAYCFRVPITNRQDLRVPWPKPDTYYPERYELLLRYIQAHPCISFTKLTHPGVIPRGKFDSNACGPFTTDYVGGNTGYPEGDGDTRQRIIKDHEDYQKGFYWFLANDRRVPERLRKEAQEFGLCKDEFPENNHWPHQLYIREARRMVGSYVMKYDDIMVDITKEDGIGMASFIADSHPVQRIVNEKGYVEEEGHFAVRTRPYEIAYRSLVPQLSECSNLLVPVCLSASHVAYGSIRMEPVFMLLGHSAGIAAAMAVQQGAAVQQVDFLQLRGKLLQQGQVLQNPAEKKP